MGFAIHRFRESQRKLPAMTYFRAGRTIIGPKCLTAVFGMGTGVATWVWSPAVSFGRVDRDPAGRILYNSVSIKLHLAVDCTLATRAGRGQCGQTVGC